MPDILVLERPITRQELTPYTLDGEMAKAVVDLRLEIMAVGGDLHADEEQVLIERGSGQPDLWSINLYPAQPGDAWIEFDSMINLRPSQGNRSRGVDDPVLREKIRALVLRLVTT